jgi:multifunctional beta-oxidation protein
VFEGHKDFQVLPTYGVIPPMGAKIDIASLVPNFQWTQLLHGEQYLEIRKLPIPTHADTVNYPKLVEVVDKGKAAAITTGCTVKDKTSGEDLFYTETLVFVRGAGNFGGSPKGSDRGAATRNTAPPQRDADNIIEEATGEGQAAIYRLSGDLNPLHIDPSFSKRGGFAQPILHGLCFFGIAGKAILKAYGPFRNIKVRFAGPVLPGQTVVTEMWKDAKSSTIVFQARVKETGKLCISGGSADLYGDASSKL